MLPTILLNGERREVRRLEESDLVPGAMIRDVYGRNVYRLLCNDGADMIVRNVRHPDIVKAFPADSLLGEFLRVI